MKREVQKQELEVAVAIHLALGGPGGSKEAGHHLPRPRPTCSVWCFSPHCCLEIAGPGVEHGTGMGVGRVYPGEVLVDMQKPRQWEDIGKGLELERHHSWQLVELKNHHHLQKSISKYCARFRVLLYIQ